MKAPTPTAAPVSDAPALTSQTVNPLQFVTSQGRQTTVCGPLGVARVFKFYSASGSPTPTPPASGTRTLGVGLVLEVY